jgi:hypothetical protein
LLKYRITLIDRLSPSAVITVVTRLSARGQMLMINREVTMPDFKKDSTSSPQQPSKARRSEDAIDEQLEKDANEMAEEAQKVQKRNEEDRGIFTK